jgi:hypothetical protein
MIKGLGLQIAGCSALLGATLGSPAAAQMFLNQPDFKPGPIDGSDPLVGLPLPGATPAEYRAHLLWNLRAGLNVAALQCQFSPYLRTVSNYNSVIAHHSSELAEAYTVLNGYFKRTSGAKEGQRKFDDYSTITYNNFSTMQAQYGFCQTAADIAKQALTQQKGMLYVTAQQRMRELRNSLVPAYDQITGYNPYAIAMPTLPQLDEKCFDKKNRLKKQCGPNYTAAVAMR